MAVQELRAHLRIKAEGRAILQLDDGSRVRCTLYDMSLGGAYMIRSTEFGPPAKLTVGEIVQVTMFDPHHGGSYVLEAEVVRVEALDGPGVAVRWRHKEDHVEAFESHIQWEAKAQHVPKSALGVPILQYPQSKLGAAERITKAVVPVAIFGLVFGIVSVAATWLKVVMTAG